MIPRQMKVELFAIFLWCAVVMRLDKKEGIRTAAYICRWYANRCRNVGNWAWTQAIHADNAYKELIEP